MITSEDIGLTDHSIHMVKGTLRLEASFSM